MAFTILLVEDNAADAELVRECVASWPREARLEHVSDGASALRRIERGPRPDLVLLDLQLPVRSGLSVLEAMKSHRELRRIPVVVLTSSADARDVRTAYALHANTYVQKSLRLEEDESRLALLGRYWMDVAEPPS